MKALLVVAIAVLSALLGPVTVMADFTQLISYQGMLTDSDGQPIPDTTIEITFSIYRVSGVMEWSSGPQPVHVTDGLFSYILGSNVPLPSDAIPSGFARYLGIKIGAEAEMVPRTQLVAVPFAYNALRCDTSEFSKGVADGVIVNADISSSANIATSKISGTAVNLTSPQSIDGDKTFAGEVRFGDSTMIVNNYGISIGDPTPHGSSGNTLIEINRDWNTALTVGGINCLLENQGSSTAIGHSIELWTATNYSAEGVSCRVLRFPSAYSGTISGGRFEARSGDVAYGLWCSADSANYTYGIYATRWVSTANYAGYFYGNTHTTGTSTMAEAGYRIDHPADPENKFLMHSDVGSPEKKNIYDGTVVTDEDGYAIVELPGYFESLNSNFRYQLTVIGTFAQAIIAEKINAGRFSIRTDKPNVEVCWQVTGIRKDLYALASPMQVEVEKSPQERGLYQNPELFGYGMEKSIDGKQHQEAVAAQRQD